MNLAETQGISIIQYQIQMKQHTLLRWYLLLNKWYFLFFYQNDFWRNASCFVNNSQLLNVHHLNNVENE